MPPILIIAYSAAIGYLLWKRGGRAAMSNGGSEACGPQASPNRNEHAVQRERDPEMSAAKERVAIYTGGLYNRSAMNLARGLAHRGSTLILW